MKDIKIEIDPRFIVDTDCEYWRGIDFCSECDWHSTIINPDDKDYLWKFVCGIVQTDIGPMFVVECPECFHKWRFHVKGMYKIFEDVVKRGANNFFK